MPLSVGIELEGIALSPKNPPTTFPTSRDLQLKILTNALKTAGLPAKFDSPDSPDSSPKPGSDSQTQVQSKSEPQHTWIVTRDGSVVNFATDSDSYSSSISHRFGFEISSPVFWTTVGDGWGDDIEKAMEAVTGCINWGVNKSTGLHVHVGRGEGKKFRLFEVKRVAKLFCRFEKSIDNFYPLHRRGDKNVYARSNRLNVKFKDLKSLPEVCSLIDGAEDIDQLCSVFNPGTHDGSIDRFYKINLVPLWSERGIGTIEFRQAPGTTSARTTKSWVRFYVDFVAYAIRTQDMDLTTGGCSLGDLEKLVALPVQYEI